MTELDYLLIGGVTLLCLAMAYLRHPAVKALMLVIPLPIWVKAPLVLAIVSGLVLVIVSGLVLVKHGLQGAMSTFPMLGVIATYETRQSLYTTSRIIPVSCFAFAVMCALCRLVQEWIGLRVALLPGPALYGGIVFLFRRAEFRTLAAQLCQAAGAAPKSGGS